MLCWITTLRCSGAGGQCRQHQLREGEDRQPQVHPTARRWNDWTMRNLLRRRVLRTRKDAPVRDGVVKLRRSTTTSSGGRQAALSKRHILDRSRRVPITDRGGACSPGPPARSVRSLTQGLRFAAHTCRSDSIETTDREHTRTAHDLTQRSAADRPRPRGAGRRAHSSSNFAIASSRHAIASSEFEINRTEAG